MLRRDSFEFGASLLPQHVPVHAAPADDLPTPAPLRRESTGHHSVDSAPDDVPKMELVLDLDHTLLNAVEAPGVGLPPPGCTAFTLQSPGGGEVRYLLRLRDGLASFLEQAARIAQTLGLEVPGTWEDSEEAAEEAASLPCGGLPLAQLVDGMAVDASDQITDANETH